MPRCSRQDVGRSPSAAREIVVCAACQCRAPPDNNTHASTTSSDRARPFSQMQDAQQCGWYSRPGPPGRPLPRLLDARWARGRRHCCHRLSHARRPSALPSPGRYIGPVVKWLRNVNVYSTQSQPWPVNAVNTPVDAFGDRGEPTTTRQQVEALLARITAGYDVPGDEMEDMEPLAAHTSLRDIAPYGRRQYQRQAQGQPIPLLWRTREMVKDASVWTPSCARHRQCRPGWRSPTAGLPGDRLVLRSDHPWTRPSSFCCHHLGIVLSFNAQARATDPPAKVEDAIETVHVKKNSKNCTVLNLYLFSRWGLGMTPPVGRLFWAGVEACASCIRTKRPGRSSSDLKQCAVAIDSSRADGKHQLFRWRDGRQPDHAHAKRLLPSV
ncbi:hypothetical protein pclt_cds_696 [Pandoravirus celtis]|uniref:Uncharacterized protein n=1 Tax=Pandoravirus celtis TaxID=2568002 RepID=A0A4D6EIM6_9VIRU|nr:hypothetical protein pclt_cds_696 [Pandoravirus celtis]